MKIEFYIPRWGNRHLSWTDFAEKAKLAGYAGVEAGLPAEPAEQLDMFTQLKVQGLHWIGQHFETTTSDFEEHAHQFERRLYALAAENPVLINSQTGKDFFTFEQNSELIALAARISQETGLRILHETHRGKFSFCTSATVPYLHRYPDLRITADFSHWCCVAESYLQDQQETLQLAVDRTDHFHSRIGFPGGPQVSHPAAPEWKEALDFHCVWWDAIVQRHSTLKTKTLTITCEFGPYPYMPHLPFNQEPVSDLWELNLFMKSFLEKRYAYLSRISQ